MRKTAAYQARCCTLLFFKTRFKLSSVAYHNDSHIEKPCNRTLHYCNTKKRIYYKTSLFGKFCFFPQNIAALRNKIK